MTPEWLHALPAVNATLNATSGLALLTGFILIKRKKIAAHRAAMLTACASSVLFLASYLTYHYFAGTTRFTGTGAARTLYFAILLTHTVLAVVVVPMAIASVVNGLRMRVPQHRRIARWTWPIWMYVSVTGVLVYVFLYHLYPSRG
jgi:uncharacterized membrane protein YozB (DUF420 family)